MKTGIPLEPGTDTKPEALNTLRFACPQCGQHIKCDKRGVGQIVECPTCRAAFAAPEPGQSEQPQGISGVT